MKRNMILVALVVVLLLAAVGPASADCQHMQKGCGEGYQGEVSGTGDSDYENAQDQFQAMLRLLNAMVQRIQENMNNMYP